MKCLMRFDWVKLMRSTLPSGKGIMSAWAKLASRAAFRKGYATYCGYKNEVIPGMWSGGIVGVKSILGVKSRTKAFEILDKLSELGYIQYTFDPKTKKLTYQITDWVACKKLTVCASYRICKAYFVVKGRLGTGNADRSHKKGKRRTYYSDAR